MGMGQCNGPHVQELSINPGVVLKDKLQEGALTRGLELTQCIHCHLSIERPSCPLQLISAKLSNTHKSYFIGGARHI